MRNKKNKKSPPRRKAIKIKRSGRPKNSLGIHTQRHLKNANNLLEKGLHAESAPIFEQIANGAYDQKLKQCAWLYVRSGQAYILSGQADKGLSLFKKGLKFLADTNKRDLFSKIEKRITFQLENEFGQPELLHQLQSWIDTKYPAFRQQVEDSNFSNFKLPLRCLSCGSTVVPVEIEKTVDGMFNCAYCGKNL